MKNSVTRPISRCCASRFVLTLAFASAATACSGTYPLGNVSHEEQPLGGSSPAPGAQSGDARVDALLAAPDVSIASVEARFDTLAAVGDMDGDGKGDMAITATDDVTGVSYVQVRYGGPRPLDAEAAFAFDRSGAFLTLEGRSMSLSPFAAGDVDGDGFDDLILMTMECDITQPGEGAYLVYGGERLEGTLSLPSVAAYFAPAVRDGDDWFGIGCGGSLASGPGDIDGDGIDDFVLARHPNRDRVGSFNFGSGEGVYVFYGRTERFSGDLQFSDADFSLDIDAEINPTAAGDVNGDGLADLLVTPVEYDWPPSQPGTFLLAGRTQRYSGELDLAANTRLLAGATPSYPNGISDLDGDGFDDLLLGDAERRLHLFYGSPAAFDAGFDFDQADAVFPESNGSQAFSVGDRDADGDDDLLDLFIVPGTLPFGMDVVFASGSRERFSGDVFFPESDAIAQTPNGRFPSDPYRLLSYAIPAGDLDGDGAADLFTASTHFELLPDGYYQPQGFQLHIHYGTPASLVRDPR